MVLRTLPLCVSFFLSLKLSICIKSHPAAGERTRVFVTVVYCHGDRSPITAYPTDPYQESAWPQGFGQLTQEGMRQHFQFGQKLRQRYEDFLNETYKRQEIIVQSTDVDRTLSAEVTLAGLYPPSGFQVFNSNLHWQPIPVHTVPLAEERDFLGMVGNNTGLHNATMETAWGVYDTLFCEALHNFPPPSWVTPEVMETLKELNDFSFRLRFDVYKREEKSRLQGGVLLGQILKNISAAAVNESRPPLKMIMYSAHDTTIAALQSALKLFNGKQPPYASCHMFELFQEDDGSFSLAMFYWNDSTKEPYPLVLPGCVKYCPLKDFICLTEPVIPVNWKVECHSSFVKNTGTF